jgi:hypothetical protein
MTFTHLVSQHEITHISIKSADKTSGVVLLEIGLWEPAITLEKNQFKHARDPYVIQAQLQKQTTRRLGARMGERYKQVVLKCLSGDFGVVDDTKEDLKLQQAFRTQIVDVLERAAANV